MCVCVLPLGAGETKLERHERHHTLIYLSRGVVPFSRFLFGLQVVLGPCDGGAFDALLAVRPAAAWRAEFLSDAAAAAAVGALEARGFANLFGTQRVGEAGRGRGGARARERSRGRAR